MLTTAAAGGSGTTAPSDRMGMLASANHSSIAQSSQFTCPQPDIGKVPTHTHTNDRPGQQPHQAPLQYQGAVAGYAARMFLASAVMICSASVMRSWWVRWETTQTRRV